MTTPEPPPAGLAAVEHFVVLMMENRSLDHMLGYLYADSGNVSPAGDPFEGLTGAESCPGTDGQPVTVYQITPDTTDAYFMPGSDPDEGYDEYTSQCFGSTSPASGTVAPMNGFVTSFAEAIPENESEGWYVFPGTAESWIMGCYTPQTLPVLSALASGFAVCDNWFCSVPGMTIPNRAFLHAATSQGHLEDEPKTYTCGSIFGALTTAGVPWKIYGYSATALTKADFPDTSSAPAGNFGLFTDFQADAAAGSLPGYAFLEPSWSSTGNSQHPNYNVALGEQMLLDTYRALRDGPAWDSTLLIITYDEHGGTYDHVPPPWGAIPPDTTPGEFGFDFTRFGPRVPTILVSPLIPAGTVHRVPTGSMPFDHTSVLATIEHRFGISPLTKRDAAAPDVGSALTLTTPRTDDPLSGVTAPAPPPNPPGLADEVSHMQRIQAEVVAEQAGRPAAELDALRTNADFQHYITAHS
jgi:phospholipase C